MTITEVPFFQHGMEFKSKVRFHFTLEVGEDGGLRTYWGKHDWTGEGEDRVPCKTENATERHDDMGPALDWLEARINERVNAGR